MNKPLLIPALLAVAGLAVCAHLACASAPESSPATLRQGAFRPVRPPTFTPAEDAPITTGQPEVPRPMPQVEPGPKLKRVLPQDETTRRHPGIWASSAPEAKPIFDWNVPVPDDDEPAAERIKQCAAAMSEASARGLRAHEIQSFNKINIDWRKCWPHAAVVRCLDSLGNAASPVSERKTFQRARDFARVAMADTCSGGAGMWSPGFVQALDRVWGAR